MRKLDMSECDIRHKTLDHVTEACCCSSLLYLYFHLPSVTFLIQLDHDLLYYLEKWREIV